MKEFGETGKGLKVEMSAQRDDGEMWRMESREEMRRGFEEKHWKEECDKR